MAERGSDITYEFCCNVCEEDSVNREAMFYCQQCAKGLCDDCIGMHKQFYKKHVAYDRGEMDKWPETTKAFEYLKFCQKHSNHLIDMFCEDHSKLCCSRCLFHDHRLCKTLVLIEEKAKVIINANDYRQMTSAFVDAQHKLETAIGDTQECLKILQESYDNAYEEIKKLRRKIDDILEQIERNTIQALDKVLQTLKQALISDAENCSKAKDGLKRISQVVLNVGDMPTELSFIAYNTSLELVSQAENLLKEININKRPAISFQQNTDLEQKLSNYALFGDIKHVKKQSGTKEKEIFEFQKNTDIEQKQSNYALFGDIKREEKKSGSKTIEIIKCGSKSEQNVRLTSDKYQCEIIGIYELPTGDILIADCYNRKVKLLDKQFKVIAHAKLSYSLWDMCCISPTEVAVTVDNGVNNVHNVQFLSVNNRQIVQGRVLGFNHACFGMTHFNGKLFITSYSALYQYTMDGKMVKKIYEDTSGDFTVFKCAVSQDGSRLYVINHSHNKLLTLSMDGTVLSSLKDPALCIPTGVHVSETGQLLICGRGSNNVVQVNGEGGVVTLASKEKCVYTESVYYSARSCKMIIGQKSDTILVISTK